MITFIWFSVIQPGFNQDIWQMKPPSPHCPCHQQDGGARAAQHPERSGPPWKGNFPGRREQAPDSSSNLKAVLCFTSHTLDLYMTQKVLIQVYNQSFWRLYCNGQWVFPLQLFSNSSCPSFGRAEDLFTTEYNTEVFSVIQAAIGNRETASS